MFERFKAVSEFSGRSRDFTGILSIMRFKFRKRRRLKFSKVKFLISIW